MSLDNSIRAIAYAESSTLGGALAQIAKRRHDLEAALRAEATRPMPLAGQTAATARALRTIETQHLLDLKA